MRIVTEKRKKEKREENFLRNNWKEEGLREKRDWVRASEDFYLCIWGKQSAILGFKG